MHICNTQHKSLQENNACYKHCCNISSCQITNKCRKKTSKLHQMSPKSLLVVNQFIYTILLDPNRQSDVKCTTLNYHGTRNHTKLTCLESTMIEWDEDTSKKWVVLVTYPHITHAPGIRGKEKNEYCWVKSFLNKFLDRYSLYYNNKTKMVEKYCDDEIKILLPPDQSNFDATCDSLLYEFDPLWRKYLLGNKGKCEIGKDYLEKSCINEDVRGVGDSVRRARELRMKKTQTEVITLKNSTSNVKKKVKEARVWYDGKGKVTHETMAALDKSEDINNLSSIYTLNTEEKNTGKIYQPDIHKTFLCYLKERFHYCLENWKGMNMENNRIGGWTSPITKILDRVVPNMLLSSSDLDKPLNEIYKLLTSKNVSSKIASEICLNIRTNLVGKKIFLFSRVKTVVLNTLEITLEKILNQMAKQHINILSSVIAQRQDNRTSVLGKRREPIKPYVITVVGINGVGKSTSLAKIAYYLKLNGCNPCFAACDTFRSGAVEQLAVHAKCLELPLYQKGYAMDPAVIAKGAISQAQSEGYDVILIDTAGRMHNNIPLMKALSRLVVENQPDMVLFVCEALVGNSGAEQLNMFNKALKAGGYSRKMDGIFLTKFDTVSDKVGSVLNMTYITGVPVIFVGTGQKYNHLKKLNTHSVIRDLLV